MIPIFSFSSLGLRHAKRDTLSDTQAIPLLKRYSHGFSQVFVCAVMSIASRPHMASIEPEPIRTGNHEHRQLLILSISDLSYVHAPNTVNRYSELGKTIPMSHRAPSHILSFACRSGVFCGQFALSFRVLGEGVMLHHVAMLFLIFKIQYFCRHGRTIFLANTIHILVLSSACGHEAAQKLGCLKQYLRIVKHLNARSIWFYLVCLDH